MRPWFKNVSAYSTSTCPSHSKMPKSPVRAENSIPEAQICFAERFLRDLFNAPGHGSVCGGGRHQNRVPILFYVCFYGNGPLEPRFSTQTLIFCVCRDLGAIYLKKQVPLAGARPPQKSMLEWPETDRKHPKMCVWFYVIF